MSVRFDDAVRLAHEIQDALAEWKEPYYEGPWEHLGDAERDVRVLLDGLMEAEAWQRDHDATWQRLTPHVRGLYMHAYRQATNPQP